MSLASGLLVSFLSVIFGGSLVLMSWSYRSFEICEKWEHGGDLDIMAGASTIVHTTKPCSIPL